MANYAECPRCGWKSRPHKQVSAAARELTRHVTGKIKGAECLPPDAPGEAA